MTHPYGRKLRTEEPLDESERGEWKSWLKTQHSKNEDDGIQFHYFMANRWGNNENSERLYFLVLQNHCRCWLQPWNQKTLALWKKSLISLESKGLSRVFSKHHSSKVSILWCSVFFIVQLSHPYMTTGKTMALTRWTFVVKVISLFLICCVD